MNTATLTRSPTGNPAHSKYHGHTPLAVRHEPIALAPRQSYNLPHVRQDGHAYVVLHWLAHGLRLPVQPLEAAASDWAAAQGEPLAQLWVAGFSEATVPCLPLGRLQAFLRHAMPDHATSSRLADQLDHITVQEQPAKSKDGRPPKFDAAQQARVRELHEQGLSNRKIASELGCSHSLINKMLQDSGH